MVTTNIDNLKTGVVRAIKPNGQIEEATLKEGKKHGLSRTVFTEENSTFVLVKLSNNGELVSEFKFNEAFEEVMRQNDALYMLGDLHPSSFQ